MDGVTVKSTTLGSVLIASGSAAGTAVYKVMFKKLMGSVSLAQVSYIDLPSINLWRQMQHVESYFRYKTKMEHVDVSINFLLTGILSFIKSFLRSLSMDNYILQVSLFFSLIGLINTTLLWPFVLLLKATGLGMKYFKTFLFHFLFKF